MVRVSGVSRRRFLGLVGSAGAFSLVPAALRGLASTPPADVALAPELSFNDRLSEMLTLQETYLELNGQCYEYVRFLNDDGKVLSERVRRIERPPYWIVPKNSEIYTGLERKAL